MLDGLSVRATSAHYLITVVPVCLLGTCLCKSDTKLSHSSILDINSMFGIESNHFYWNKHGNSYLGIAQKTIASRVKNIENTAHISLKGTKMWSNT